MLKTFITFIVAVVVVVNSSINKKYFKRICCHKELIQYCGTTFNKRDIKSVDPEAYVVRPEVILVHGSSSVVKWTVGIRQVQTCKKIKQKHPRVVKLLEYHYILIDI